ncbi:MAG: BatA domain-containing protein, partial [Gemmatimonadetes bacterium]|nr:BatA domain-containing protein [Gemmatimonadota bacterium]
MSFLAPLALGLAALAALPVVLHLFHRDTRRRLAFPAIRYLRRARDRSARALKLRDRLLLATRVALVLILAAAAAAPLAGRGDVSDHVPTDVLLLIDNTGSMNRLSGETTLLDRQRSRALALLQAARSGDRFWVLPAVGPVLASGVPAGVATEAVADVEATDA